MSQNWQGSTLEHTDHDFDVRCQGSAAPLDPPRPWFRPESGRACPYMSKMAKSGRESCLNVLTKNSTFLVKVQRGPQSSSGNREKPGNRDNVYEAVATSETRGKADNGGYGRERGAGIPKTRGTSGKRWDCWGTRGNRGVACEPVELRGNVRKRFGTSENRGYVREPGNAW